MNDGVVRDQIIAEMREAGIIEEVSTSPIRVVDGRKYVVLVTVADLTQLAGDSSEE